MRFILIILLTCSINAFKINDIQFKTINKDNIIHSDSLFEIILNVSEPLYKDTSIIYLNWQNETLTMPFKFFSQNDNVYTWSLYTNSLEKRPTKTYKTLKIHPKSTLFSKTGNSINIQSKLSLTYVNSCILPENMIGYDIDRCSKELTKVTDCIIQCQPGATSGNVELVCMKNDDYFNVSGCSKRCENIEKEGYIGCSTTETQLSKEMCDVRCENGFRAVSEIEKICENDGDDFVFNGCKRICKLEEVDSSFIVSDGCMEGTVDECEVKCATGYVDTGVKSTCLSNGLFYLDGCDLATCENSDTISCDDNVQCTDDICDSGECLNILNNKKCDDNVECTKNICQKDGCHINFNNEACNDNVKCTLDMCTTTGCTHTLQQETCNDNNVCTIDECTLEGCSHTFLDCGDGIDCTLDECDPFDGCIHTPIHDSCNDFIDCTIDTCSMFEGCLYKEDVSLCDDGISCTVDVCSERGCTHTKNHSICQDNADCSVNTCNPDDSNDLSGCVNKYNHRMCYDGKGCTKDSCTSEGCKHENVCLRSHGNRTECVLTLEMYEDGTLTKPYTPCLEGKTFAECSSVEVTLMYRFDEIELTELKQISETPTKELCNPDPCINSTCVNTTGSYECICPEGQKGRHCEFLKVKEAPAYELSFILSLIIGIGLLVVIILNRKKKIQVAKKSRVNKKYLKPLTFIIA